VGNGSRRATKDDDVSLEEHTKCAQSLIPRERASVQDLRQIGPTVNVGEEHSGTVIEIELVQHVERNRQPRYEVSGLTQVRDGRGASLVAIT
jgi:hypothetical protein